uniref:SET domain-containing protein n=1 Tax=Sinocyclocheilus rhinocerous TaxID=307959 RepID=A0A673H8S7_9TELE
MDREGKGLGVVTSRPFVCGELICDFHGRLVSRDEGLQIHQNTEAQAGHLFFFTSKNGQGMCLDAHEDNLSPRLHFVEDDPVILFMATRDIQTGEEIRYDYGDHMRSYAGDGLDLTPRCVLRKHPSSSRARRRGGRPAARIYYKSYQEL